MSLRSWRWRRAGEDGLDVAAFAVRLLALQLMGRVIWIRPRGLLDELLSGRTETLNEGGQTGRIFWAERGQLGGCLPWRSLTDALFAMLVYH